MAGPAQRIEDYALIGDTQTAALVGKNGSIDWLCLPRFDSGACFAALLGDASNGRWLLAPKGEVRRVSRRYEPSTLVLVTEFTTDDGVVEVFDCMPVRRYECSEVLRIVRGVRGSVAMRMELVIRFDYGSSVPWVSKQGGVLRAVAGPHATYLRTNVPTSGKGLTTQAEFIAHEGESIPFMLGYYPSHLTTPAPIDPYEALDHTFSFWRSVGGAGDVPRAMARPGRALAHYAEGADLCAHGWHRRRPVHFAPRTPGGRAQLGLPLLLVTRRDVHVVRLDDGRLPRRSFGVARLAGARRGG